MIDSSRTKIEKFGNDNNLDNRSETQVHKHPDFSAFMKKINERDLSRPNLFLVRFDGFTPTKNNGAYTLNKLKELGMSLAMETEIGKYALGAYNPKIIEPLIGTTDRRYASDERILLDGVMPKDFDPNREIAMLVKSVNVPGTSFDTSKLYHDRSPMTVVTGRTVNTVTMQIYLTADHLQRSVFLAWMNEVHDQDTNEFGFYDDYAKSIDIYPLDRRAIPSSVTKCTRCFPIRVGDVQYDTDSNNAIATVEVEFAVSTVKTASYDSGTPMIDNVYSYAENIGMGISQLRN